MKSLKELLAWAKQDLRGLLLWVIGLQEELQRLKDLLAQNSQNSSLPPSSDRRRHDRQPKTNEPAPKPKSLRRKCGRKPGGQRGHPGRTLEFCDQPKEIQVHRLEECACGEDLSGQPAQDFERRQIFDLPPLQLACKEHRAEIKDCPCCLCRNTAPFPAEVKAPVQYGKNFMALLSYLYDAQQCSSRRIRQMCAELFGYAVSESTIQDAREAQFQALEPFDQRLEQILPQEPVLHADETGMPINKVTHWLHVLATPLLTFFSVQAKRGAEAIKAVGIIPKFAGWLMHDFLSGYLGFDNCVHTFCKSHLLRELVFLFEEHGQAWAGRLHDLFLEMFEHVKQRKARDAPLGPKELERWYRRYRRILCEGRRANPITRQQNKRGRPKQSKAQNLLDRLQDYDYCILAFLWDFEIPFTNNEAERPLRMIKVRLKVSGCFRTLSGARRHARIASYISTVRKHGLPVFDCLLNALAGQPFLPQGTKTT
jgi:Transposase and inactivated derivatives